MNVNCIKYFGNKDLSLQLLAKLLREIDYNYLKVPLPLSFSYL